MALTDRRELTAESLMVFVSWSASPAPGVSREVAGWPTPFAGVTHLH